MQRNSNKRGIIALVAIFDLLIIAGLFFYSSHKETSHTYLEINLVPADASITIDGKKYQSGVIELPAKTTTATISHEDFEDETIELDLKPNSITEFSHLLTPSDDHYWAEHVDLLYNLETLNNAKANNIAKILGLKEYLPHTIYKYGGVNGQSEETVISERTNCVATMCLIITSNVKNGLELAKNYIKEKGFNPDDYSITYKAR